MCVCVCGEREREGGGGKCERLASFTMCFQNHNLSRVANSLMDCVSVSSDGGGGDGSDGSLICKLHHGFPEPPQFFKSCYL